MSVEKEVSWVSCQLVEQKLFIREVCQWLALARILCRGKFIRKVVKFCVGGFKFLEIPGTNSIENFFCVRSSLRSIKTFLCF